MNLLFYVINVLIEENIGCYESLERRMICFFCRGDDLGFED